MHITSFLFSFLKTLYFFKILTNIILASIRARCYPIQFLPPAEKGILVYASRLVSSSNHLSGLNSCGFGKYFLFVYAQRKATILSFLSTSISSILWLYFAYLKSIAGAGEYILRTSFKTKLT